MLQQHSRLRTRVDVGAQLAVQIWNAGAYGAPHSPAARPSLSSRLCSDKSSSIVVSRLSRRERGARTTSSRKGIDCVQRSGIGHCRSAADPQWAQTTAERRVSPSAALTLPRKQWIWHPNIRRAFPSSSILLPRLKVYIFSPSRALPRPSFLHHVHRTPIPRRLRLPWPQATLFLRALLRPGCPPLVFTIPSRWFRRFILQPAPRLLGALPALAARRPAPLHVLARPPRELLGSVLRLGIPQLRCTLASLRHGAAPAFTPDALHR